MSAAAGEIPGDETPNQRQARLRRERRNAKLQATGSARLEAITTLSGRPAPAPEEPSSTPTPTPKPAQSTSAPPISHPDPEEVDISEHYYAPQTTARPPNHNASNLDPAAGGGGAGMFNPFALAQAQGAGGGGGGNPADDPMLQMMQQLLNPGGGGGGGPDGLPPGLAQMLGSLTGGAGAGGGAGGIPGFPGFGDASQAAAAVPSTAYIWRIIHALVSLSLAAYIAVFSSFTGSKSARSGGGAGAGGGFKQGLDGEVDAHLVGQRLFYLFATFELVLQSSRFFIEKGQLAPSGFLGGLAQILPEPYAGYVRVVGRYSVIYTTIVADAMVIVFVLGLVSWWRSVRVY